MRRLLTGVLILALAGFPSAALAREYCFTDKAPYCFVGKFAPYWNDNGGLPVFGYPITIAASQANADTGQRYLTQWAERNRLELHPENAGTPYEILLGLLGKDRLRQLGRDPGAEGREAGPQAGCLWFEQTGHNVCNIAGGLGFKQYWESHGLKIPVLDQYGRSLQLFGLPLTEPKMETNASGATVLTQWFERARFEWHPGNPNEYKVLLGLLGSELRGGAPAPAPLNPADCKDVPEPISAAITPGKCFAQGMAITFEFRGFQPGEQLTMWDIAENGELTVTYPGVADSAGVLRGAFASPAENNGFWQWSVEGVASRHQATIYFRQAGAAAPPPPPTARPNCDPSYPDVCIPPPPPDLDCGDIPYRRFRVLEPDPHRFDGDNDGIGCES